MAKRLFLLLISSLIEVTLGVNFLSATDTVVTKTPGFEAVETVLEPEIEENIVEETSSEAVYTYVAPAPAPINYTVTSVTSEIVEYPSYYDIYRTGKFLYAHNSSNLFGSIGYLNRGDVFTITECGVARSYRVMDKIVYEKAANGLLNGSKAVTKAVEFEANGYDISMMTCYGTMYGNGDASHRLVLFANAI
ncbi:hypothetical protein IJH24_03430 [Candidatus Saccharibacteria bacterium]|nr:hypothetical protein [Candidatus Saccharibacteria bacterium]